MTTEQSAGSLREQIAEAIYEDRRRRVNLWRTGITHPHKCPWADWPPAYREDYYADADAALTVVRNQATDIEDAPAAAERERWAELAIRLGQRCETRCASDHEASEWHEGYRFAMREFAARLSSDMRLIPT